MYNFEWYDYAAIFALLSLIPISAALVWREIVRQNKWERERRAFIAEGEWIQ